MSSLKRILTIVFGHLDGFIKAVVEPMFKLCIFIQTSILQLRVHLELTHSPPDVVFEVYQPGSELVHVDVGHHLLDPVCVRKIPLPLLILTRYRCSTSDGSSKQQISYLQNAPYCCGNPADIARTVEV